VAIPIGYDQPSVAARIARHGVCEFLEIGDVTVGRVQRFWTIRGIAIRLVGGRT
jgi:hypothetical protein